MNNRLLDDSHQEQFMARQAGKGTRRAIAPSQFGQGPPDVVVFDDRVQSDADRVPF